VAALTRWCIGVPALVLLACSSGADASPSDQYAHLIPFDTARVRIVARSDTAVLAVELAETPEQQTMAPCQSMLAEGCPSYPAGAAYRAALEVNAGYFARRQIHVGDRVLLQDTVARRPAGQRRRQ
jgi:hypothetical protein